MNTGKKKIHFRKDQFEAKLYAFASGTYRIQIELTNCEHDKLAVTRAAQQNVLLYETNTEEFNHIIQADCNAVEAAECKRHSGQERITNCMNVRVNKVLILLLYHWDTHRFTLHFHLCTVCRSILLS